MFTQPVVHQVKEAYCLFVKIMIAPIGTIVTEMVVVLPILCVLAIRVMHHPRVTLPFALAVVVQVQVFVARMVHAQALTSAFAEKVGPETNAKAPEL